jgi:general secretion pathway protein G
VLDGPPRGAVPPDVSPSPGLDGSARSRRRSERGLTFVELVAVCAIMMIMAAAALPLGVNAYQRAREIELRRALVTMRSAIDQYHEYAKVGAIPPWDPDWELYPKDFDMLIDGVEITSPQNPVPTTVKFLRKVPVDPMTGEAVWGMRSYQDEPDSDSWGEENLYDVYSLSTGVALDGTEYRTW